MNLAAHVLAALLLFGIVRRTLLLPGFAGRFAPRGHAAGRCRGVALGGPSAADRGGDLHRPADGGVGGAVLPADAVLCDPRRVVATAAGRLVRGRRGGLCLLAMGSKEAAVSAPLVVLLYDRVFLEPLVARGFSPPLGPVRGPGRQLDDRAGHASPRQGRDAVFGHGGQAFDYALGPVRRDRPLSAALFLAASAGARLRLLHAASAGQIIPLRAVDRRVCWLPPASRFATSLGWAFLGVWFFAILAPSSSVVPLFQQIAAEKRMYLPLGGGGDGGGDRRVSAGPAVARPTVAGRLAAGGAAADRLRPQRRDRGDAGIPDLRAKPRLPQQPLHLGGYGAKTAANARAQVNLGAALARRGRIDKAIGHFREAVKLKPDYADAQSDLGGALSHFGKFDEAIACIQEALRIDPDYAKAYFNLGTALVGRGQLDDAIGSFQKALKLKPDLTEAHLRLGMALAGRGRTDEAIDQYRKFLSVEPDTAEEMQ